MKPHVVLLRFVTLRQPISLISVAKCDLLVKMKMGGKHFLKRNPSSFLSVYNYRSYSITSFLGYHEKVGVIAFYRCIWTTSEMCCSRSIRFLVGLQYIGYSCVACVEV
jgi:hypothetical protein